MLLFARIVMFVSARVMVMFLLCDTMCTRNIIQAFAFVQYMYVLYGQVFNADFQIKNVTVVHIIQSIYGEFYNKVKSK